MRGRKTFERFDAVVVVRLCGSESDVEELIVCWKMEMDSLRCYWLVGKRQMGLRLGNEEVPTSWWPEDDGVVRLALLRIVERNMLSCY